MSWPDAAGGSVAERGLILHGHHHVERIGRTKIRNCNRLRQPGWHDGRFGTSRSQREGFSFGRQDLFDSLAS